MNYTEWVNKLDSTTYFKYLDTINILKKLFKNFTTRYRIIKITDDILIKSLNNIIDYQKVLIAYDIEFQHTLYDIYIRELGLIIFIKDDNSEWFYIGNIFINFQHLTKHGFNILECKYIQSKYATVTDSSNELMKEIDKYFYVDNILNELYNSELFKDRIIYNESVQKIKTNLKNNELVNKYVFKKRDMLDKLEEIETITDYDTVKKCLDNIKRYLKDIPFQVYGKDLKGVYLKKFKEQWKIYSKDKYVKERTITSSKEKEFLSLFIELIPKTCFVVKGKNDMIAVNNTYKLLFKKPNNITFKSYYDIEMFNGFSKIAYGNAQLETTYHGVINTDIYENHVESLFSKIFDSLGNNKKIEAHNPLIDSIYTMVVAIVFNMGLNVYFQNKYKIGGNIYEYKYHKYKSKYNNIKKSILL